MNVRRVTWFCAVSIAVAGTAARSDAAVLTAPLGGLREAIETLQWGSTGFQLRQAWSYRDANSGFVYGTNWAPQTNVDVAVVFGMTNPTLMTNAESLTYTRGSLMFREGDSVFFRGTNGRYGAWRIDRVDPDPWQTGGALGLLYGQWYYQTDATGNFTIPEPTSLAGLALGSYLLRRRR